VSVGPRADVIEAELTNLERLLGLGRSATVPAPSTSDGGLRDRLLELALEAFRRCEITRSKLEELAALVKLSKDDVSKLLENAGLDAIDEVGVFIPDEA
jgi:hypothetical protein